MAENHYTILRLHPLTASVYTLSDSRLVAKLEKKSTKSSLLQEYKVYCWLSGLPFAPKFFFFGEESGYFRLILENVGYNIEELFRLKQVVVPSVVESGSLAAVVAIEIVSPFPYRLESLIADTGGDSHP